jgi:hypothetical protein
MAKISIVITAEDSEVIEMFSITSDADKSELSERNKAIDLAWKVKEHLYKKFEVEED